MPTLARAARGGGRLVGALLQRDETGTSPPNATPTLGGQRAVGGGSSELCSNETKRERPLLMRHQHSRGQRAVGGGSSELCSNETKRERPLLMRHQHSRGQRAVGGRLVGALLQRDETGTSPPNATPTLARAARGGGRLVGALLQRDETGTSPPNATPTLARAARGGGRLVGALLQRDETGTSPPNATPTLARAARGGGRLVGALLQRGGTGTSPPNLTPSGAANIPSIVASMPPEHNHGPRRAVPSPSPISPCCRSDSERTNTRWNRTGRPSPRRSHPLSAARCSPNAGTLYRRPGAAGESARILLLGRGTLEASSTSLSRRSARGSAGIRGGGIWAICGGGALLQRGARPGSGRGGPGRNRGGAFVSRRSVLPGGRSGEGGHRFRAAPAAARAAGATAEHWTALYGIARIARRRADTAAAIARLREAIAILEAPRPTAPAPSLQPDFLPDTRDVYSAAIGILLDSPARDTAQLFRWVEQAGSRNRRDAVRGPRRLPLWPPSSNAFPKAAPWWNSGSATAG